MSFCANVSKSIERVHPVAGCCHDNRCINGTCAIGAHNVDILARQNAVFGHPQFDIDIHGYPGVAPDEIVMAGVDHFDWSSCLLGQYRRDQMDIVFHLGAKGTTVVRNDDSYVVQIHTQGFGVTNPHHVWDLGSNPQGEPPGWIYLR